MSVGTKQEKAVVLSRFFSRNTNLVAGMCWKCYKDESDVKIVAINGIFLKKTKKYEEYSNSLSEDIDLENCLIVLDGQQNLRPDLMDTKPQIKKEDFFIKNEEIINKNLVDIIKYENIEKQTSKFFKDDFKTSLIKPKFFKSLQNPEDLKTTKLNFDYLNHGIKYDIKFVPPKSPYNLIEESLYHDPWALLVATIFLNRTKLKQSRPYIEWFLADHKNPYHVLRSEIASLEKYFVNLGLQQTRSIQVFRMSHDFLHKNWKNAEELYGIGHYGRDAFNMFCLGNFKVKPKDRYLRIYRDWYVGVFLEKNKDFDKNFLVASSQSDLIQSGIGEKCTERYDLTIQENEAMSPSSDYAKLSVLAVEFEEFYMANCGSGSCLSLTDVEDKEEY